MTVACDMMNCGYNNGGICCQKCYVIIRGGQCQYLQKYPNSFTQCWDPQEMFEYVQETPLKDASDIGTELIAEEKPKKKRGRPRKNPVDNNEKS